MNTINGAKISTLNRRMLEMKYEKLTDDDIKQGNKKAKNLGKKFRVIDEQIDIALGIKRY